MTRMYISAQFLGVLVYFVGQSVFADLLVSLPDGDILGYERRTPESSANRSFYAYHGIPYAAPPTGNLRFQPPVPPSPWNGTLDASKESGICYQISSNSEDETEDCLYLNVYTPVLNVSTNTSKLPVILWIYGGGFSHGDSKYAGMGPDYFIEQDVVVVSFNYRLGPFGFLSTGDEVLPGNAGLKDQLLALKWTNKNIHLFGGDPEKITLVGQSAGAASVGYHILSKKSAGLFRAGIAASGSALSIWGYINKPRDYVLDLARQINKETFNGSEFNSTFMLDFLVNNVTAKEIDDASTKTSITTALPVLEPVHDEAFLTEPMYEVLDKGDFNKVPLLIGTVSEEELGLGKDVDKLNKSVALFEKEPYRLIPTDLNESYSTNKTEIGEAIANLYWKYLVEWERIGYLIKYYSDNQFSRAVLKHAEMQSAYTPVYFYYFSYYGEMGNVLNISIPGAGRIGHGGEKYYFAKLNSTTYDNSDLTKFSEYDLLTHRRMVKIWTDFVKYGNPTFEQSDLLQNITWPSVTPEKYYYLHIDSELRVDVDPKGIYYTGWKDIFDKYGQRPFTTY